MALFSKATPSGLTSSDYGMGANPNLPQPGLEPPSQWRVTTGGRQRRMRRYLIGAVILAILVIIFLVVWVVSFAGRGPATRPQHGPKAPTSEVVLPGRFR